MEGGVCKWIWKQQFLSFNIPCCAGTPALWFLFCFISSLPLTQWLLPSPNLAELTPLSLAPGEDPNLFSSLARLSSGTLFTSVVAILVIFASMTRRVRNQPSSEDCFTEISCHSISGLPGVYQYLQDDCGSDDDSSSITVFLLLGKLCWVLPKHHHSFSQQPSDMDGILTSISEMGTWRHWGWVGAIHHHTSNNGLSLHLDSGSLSPETMPEAIW